jgi:hypothetical protein
VGGRTKKEKEMTMSGMKRILLAAVCLSLCCSALGGPTAEGNVILPTFNKQLALRLEDDVKDGCLPNPNRLKDEFEVELRRLGFKVDDGLFPALVVYLMGYSLKMGGRVTGCAVYYQADLTFSFYFANSPYPINIFFPIAWEYSGLAVDGSGESMQSQMQDWARAAVNDLYLSIERSKDNN